MSQDWSDTTVSPAARINPREGSGVNHIHQGSQGSRESETCVAVHNVLTVLYIAIKEILYDIPCDQCQYILPTSDFFTWIIEYVTIKTLTKLKQQIWPKLKKKIKVKVMTVV